LETHLQYFVWDYDQGIVTEYKRLGECNGCGQCCRAVIRYVTAQEKPFVDGFLGSGSDKKGIWIEATDGDRRWALKLLEIEHPEGFRCEHLLEGNLCVVHNIKNARKDRLALCDLWPMGPQHVDPFDQCSYTFEKVSEFPID
jgi:hypothetical protein